MTLLNGLRFIHTLRLFGPLIIRFSTRSVPTDAESAHLATECFTEFDSLQLFRDQQGREWGRGESIPFIGGSEAYDLWEYWTEDRDRGPRRSPNIRGSPASPVTGEEIGSKFSFLKFLKRLFKK